MEMNIQSSGQSNMQSNNKMEKPKAKLNKVGIIVIIIFVLLLLGAIGSSIYFYRKANTNPQQDAAKDLANTVKMVGRLIVLPAGENPTMATVSDPEKLKDQAFFANAKKGDKVLIYADSRKAILYDPIADKIVEVAPINANIGAPTGN